MQFARVIRLCISSYIRISYTAHMKRCRGGERPRAPSPAGRRSAARGVHMRCSRVITTKRYPPLRRTVRRLSFRNGRSRYGTRSARHAAPFARAFKRIIHRHSLHIRPPAPAPERHSPTDISSGSLSLPLHHCGHPRQGLAFIPLKPRSLFMLRPGRQSIRTAQFLQLATSPHLPFPTLGPCIRPVGWSSPSSRRASKQLVPHSKHLLLARNKARPSLHSARLRHSPGPNALIRVARQSRQQAIRGILPSAIATP